MIEGRTEVKKAFLSGTTRRVQFQIVDKETGAGFQPSTLLLSIYDVSGGSSVWVPCPWPYHVHPPAPSTVTPVTSAIVNGQNDVDISAFVDASGNVDVYLTPEDTEIDIPTQISAHRYQRVLLFTWTWGSPAKVGKQEIVLSIAPDRETEAV
jgi:hypothetical protein